MKTMTEHLARCLATLALLSTFGATLVHAAAVQATALPSVGTRIVGVVPNTAAPPPAGSLTPPITVPTPLPVLPSGPLTAPGLSPLQATAASVTVSWSDRSSDELGFKVFRRDLTGNWQLVDQVPTRNVRGSGSVEVGGAAYTWVDTSTDLSGQCYTIAAYNATAIAYTDEECTVRPDPRRFPQVVPAMPHTDPDHQAYWHGLSDTNDGTGALVNGTQQLHDAGRTWGVNLAWGNSSLWRVEAQGGPHLMKGQAVALKVWGGGWLTYGHQTFGVDLQLSPTPVYQWYALGMADYPAGYPDLNTYAGSSLTDGGFVLWNSAAQAYLVPGYQTWGVGLMWYRASGGLAPPPTSVPTEQGVTTERVFNCATDQQPVEVWIADPMAGSGFVDQGTVAAQDGPGGCPAAGSVPLTFSPLPRHQYILIARDSARPGCAGDAGPPEGACRTMAVRFTGGATGYTRTDIVGIGTQITP
jgi:hypothetical protein